MIVILVDMLMFSVLFFMLHVLRLTRWQLVEPDKTGRGKVTGTLDPDRWAKAVKCVPNHAIADGKGLMIQGRHWALMASCIGLACHIPGCLMIYLMSIMAPYAAAWHRAVVISGAVLFVLGLTAMLCCLSIEKLHEAMEPQLEFAASIRAWADAAYEDEAERGELTYLIFRLLDLAPQAACIYHDPTPEGGREAIIDLMMELGKKGDWISRLNKHEQELYEKFREHTL